MNKESIRKKIDDAKKDAENLLRNGKVTLETIAVIKSLLIIIDIIVVVLLEKKIKKNSSNSGLPPSLNNGSNGNRNKNSGKKTIVEGSASNLKKTKTREIVTPIDCLGCGENLSSIKLIDTEERIKIDINYEIVNHSVISEIKQFPNCGIINKGNFPIGMDGKIQYGNGIKAAIINFLAVQMMSFQRVQEYFNGILDRSISQAVMLKYLYQFSESIKSWEEKNINLLLQRKYIHCDETSVRINKEKYWVHSYSSGNITLKFVHKNRGKEAIEDIGIIPKYNGTIIHDCWASYFSYDNVDHALCIGHLLRELKYIEELTTYKWAKKVKEILKEAVDLISNRPNKRVLSKNEYKSLQSRYRNALSRGKKEMPPFQEKSGNRGRTKKSEAQNLWTRLWEYENSVLMFAREKEIDPTNNRAERDLRVSKVKLKVAGCFRTEEMAHVFFRISSYLKSMRYRGYSSIEAINLGLYEKIPE